jgi:hypothetical protein
VIHIRERGVKPVSCNCWLPGLNEFGRWLHQQGEIPTPLRLPPQDLLTARTSDFDFDNLLLLVTGKRRKQRKVPFSIEPREILFRFGLPQRGFIC